MTWFVTQRARAFSFDNFRNEIVRVTGKNESIRLFHGLYSYQTTETTPSNVQNLAVKPLGSTWVLNIWWRHFYGLSGRKRWNSLVDLSNGQTGKWKGYDRVVTRYVGPGIKWVGSGGREGWDRDHRLGLGITSHGIGISVFWAIRDQAVPFTKFAKLLQSRIRNMGTKRESAMNWKTTSLRATLLLWSNWS